MTPDEIAASLFGGPTTITEPVETEPVEAVQPETVEVKPDTSTAEGEKSPECEADTQTSLARRQRNLYSLGCVALGAAVVSMFATLAPWWHLSFPGGSAAIETAGGGFQTVQLAAVEATRSGRAAGALGPAILLTVLVAVAVAAASKRLWWVSAFTLVFLTPNGLTAPPTVDVSPTIGGISPVASLSTPQWGGTLAQGAHWVALCSVAALAVATLILRHAEKRANGDDVPEASRFREVMTKSVVSQLARVGAQFSEAVADEKARKTK